MKVNRRVVVTGLGAVTPYGVGVETFWQGCVSGASAVRPLRLELDGLTCRAAGQVDFEPAAHLSKLEARRLARFCQFALVASREALGDSALDLSSLDLGRVAIALGNGSGAFSEAPGVLETVARKGWALLDPLSLVKALPDMAAANLSLALGVQGPILTCTASCSSSTIALAHALDLIRTGRADVVITGGTEAWLTPLGIASFGVLRALSTRPCPPEEASCPFDLKRDGLVPAEGAAILIVEAEEHARARGARPRAELAGAAVTSDSHHIVAPRSDGEAAARCMQQAMEDARVSAGEIDYINAHGTSTPPNDAVEVRAIRLALGAHAPRPLVSSTKSLIGHTLGAAGAIESVAVVRAIEEGVIHPGINLTEPDPACDLNHVGARARAGAVRIVLKNTFAFGGQNACLIWRRCDE